MLSSYKCTVPNIFGSLVQTNKVIKRLLEWLSLLGAADADDWQVDEAGDGCSLNAECEVTKLQGSPD